MSYILTNQKISEKKRKALGIKITYSHFVTLIQNVLNQKEKKFNWNVECIHLLTATPSMKRIRSLLQTSYGLSLGMNGLYIHLLKVKLETNGWGVYTDSKNENICH
jgi:hypothetical protein